MMVKRKNAVQTSKRLRVYLQAFLRTFHYQHMVWYGTFQQLRKLLGIQMCWIIKKWKTCRGCVSILVHKMHNPSRIPTRNPHGPLNRKVPKGWLTWNNY